jgi:hypothetical protein
MSKVKKPGTTSSEQPSVNTSNNNLADASDKPPGTTGQSQPRVDDSILEVTTDPPGPVKKPGTTPKEQPRGDSEKPNEGVVDTNWAGENRSFKIEVNLTINVL